MSKASLLVLCHGEKRWAKPRKKEPVKSGKDSIRNFKFQPNKGGIVIDEPNEDDYHFHIK